MVNNNNNNNFRNKKWNFNFYYKIFFYFLYIFITKNFFKFFSNFYKNKLDQISKERRKLIAYLFSHENKNKNNENFTYLLLDWNKLYTFDSVFVSKVSNLSLNSLHCSFHKAGTVIIFLGF